MQLYTVKGESFAGLNFHGIHNTFVVQGQGAYMLYLEQKIHGENLRTLLKTSKTTKF